MKMEKELKKIIINLSNVIKLVQIKEIRLPNIILKTIVSKSRWWKRMQINFSNISSWVPSKE